MLKMRSAECSQIRPGAFESIYFSGLKGLKYHSQKFIYLNYFWIHSYHRGGGIKLSKEDVSKNKYKTIDGDKRIFPLPSFFNSVKTVTNIILLANLMQCICTSVSWMKIILFSITIKYSKIKMNIIRNTNVIWPYI